MFFEGTAAACYLEASPEIGYIWKRNKQKLVYEKKNEEDRDVRSPLASLRVRGLARPDGEALC